MDRKEIAAKIAKEKYRLSEFNVQALYVFGSVARGEAGSGSDVDIIVGFTPGASAGLFLFVRLQGFLEDILECPVNMVTVDALHPMMKDSILEERILVA